MSRSRPLGPRAIASLVSALVLAEACASDEVVSPLGGEPGTARALGMFSSELAADPLEQARRALAEDAWSREHRFLDAVDPGHLFRSTRVTPEELARGAFSPDEVFQLGAQLFHHRLSREEGLYSLFVP